MPTAPWLAAASLVASLAGSAASGAATRPGGEETRLYLVNPFALDGKLASGLRLVCRVRGDCWIGSLMTARADAWRRSASPSLGQGGLTTIHDP
ncbi:MAG: hypothetical protein C4305_03030 [Thermoleophilia bacterium]